jgi:beta-lactamase superfamily II metal-dependent hydrolase
MRIEFLQAGNGDCIHIMSGQHHVIIDSGEVCQDLVSVVDTIKKANERIDLLIITHYDSDHIKAINGILQGMSVEDRKKLIKKVWFNATKVGFHGNEKLLSADDANDLALLLLEADIEWISELEYGIKETFDEGLSVEVIDGGEIYQPTGEGEMLGNEKCDWVSSFNVLEQYLDDDVTDDSKTNAQSAILVVHAGDHRILLPGDAIPEKLTNALDKFRKGGTLKFDLVKLPHHGSYKNITEDILSKFECSDYMISTNGKKYFHPDKKMMFKVMKWGKRVEGKQLSFHMNYYDELWKKLNITESEKRSYNLECDGKRAFEF